MPVTLKFYSQRERDYFEERAAIMQYCGGYSRAAAEYYAYQRLKDLRRKGTV